MMALMTMDRLHNVTSDYYSEFSTARPQISRDDDKYEFHDAATYLRRNPSGAPRRPAALIARHARQNWVNGFESTAKMPW